MDLAGHAVLLHVLLAWSIVLVVAHGFGRLFQKLSQPAVIGEMFAGIALGPSLLGHLAPEASALLFPSWIAPQLQLIAQIGVVLYLFVVGLEVDLQGLRSRAGTATVISTAGIAVPLLLGSLVAQPLHAHLGPAHVSTFVFGAFFCVAIAVTAFPVLARIVVDRKLDKTFMGQLALTCAAADDVAAWCMLSIVTSFAHASSGGGMLTLAWVAAYVVFMLVIVRPLLVALTRHADRSEEVSRTTLTLIFVGLLLSALATESIGIHALFGAFFLGALVPAQSRLAERLSHQLGDTVSVLVLPVFFAFTGLRTQLGLLDSANDWLVCGGIIALGFGAKLGGVYVAARACGLGHPRSLGLAALMNTRGLMELIVLNVGLDLGIISPTLFTMMVIMALVTTCAAGPILSWLARREEFASAPEERALTPVR